MFVRTKKSGAYQYLQIVQNERVEGRGQQHVIATLGRLDVLQKTGQLDALLSSCARFAEHSAVLSAHRQGRLAAAEKVAIGPALVFERLWQELGFPPLFAQLLQDHKCDETIRSHVFCSFLALVLLKKLLTRLESRGWQVVIFRGWHGILIPWANAQEA